MARSTFKVLFYLKRQAEQNGKSPVMGRIAVNGTISQFSCKMFVQLKLWDTKANKASGKSVMAEKVKNAWLGFGDGYRLLTLNYVVHYQSNPFARSHSESRPAISMLFKSDIRK